MSSSSHTILCGSCRVAVEGPSDPKHDDMITCPKCGRSDNFENVAASVKAFVEEMAGRSLQETIRKSFRGSKIIKVTTKPLPKGNHAFLVDMKL